MSNAMNAATAAVPLMAAVGSGAEFEDAPKAQRLRSVGFLISDKQAGPFQLQIDWVKAHTDPR